MYDKTILSAKLKRQGGRTVFQKLDVYMCVGRREVYTFSARDHRSFSRYSSGAAPAILYHRDVTRDVLKPTTF